MSLNGDNIGDEVRLVYTDGTVHAKGRVYMYCEQPSIGIETAAGEHLHWRADMARVVPPAEPVTVTNDLIKRARYVLSQPLPDWSRAQRVLEALVEEADAALIRPPAEGTDS